MNATKDLIIFLLFITVVSCSANTPDNRSLNEFETFSENELNYIEMQIGNVFVTKRLMGEINENFTHYKQKTISIDEFQEALNNSWREMSDHIGFYFMHRTPERFEDIRSLKTIDELTRSTGSTLTLLLDKVFQDSDIQEIEEIIEQMNNNISDLDKTWEEFIMTKQ